MVRSEQEIFLEAFLIRETERRLLGLFSEGRVAGTIHTCQGQELTGIAVAQVLGADDWMVSNHRCHGHYIARYGDWRGLVSEILGKPSGICKGMGGSQHIYRPGFLSSGVQGGMTPTAVGLALSYQRTWKESPQSRIRPIVANFIGDGTFGQGVVYETFNLASVLEAPVLFILENNHYAQSTSQKETTAGTFQARAAAFNIRGFKTSTYCLESLLKITAEAAAYCRSAGAPALLEVDTYRLAPHSKGDDFRAEAEIQAELERDLLNQFLKKNEQNFELEGQLIQIRTNLTTAIEEILAEPDSVRLGTDLPRRGSIEWQKVTISGHPVSQSKEINRAIHQEFKQRSGWMFLAEDIRDPYGGAFKISQGLSNLYPDRILNMPISEAAIVGIGLGMALSGRPAMTEIMFGDFISLAFDQILNHASKFRSMYSDVIPIPLVIRAPMGGGRGYGSTHSQSLEKFVAAVPDIEVVMLHPRTDVASVFSEVFANLDRVTVVIENKLLYSRSSQDPLPPGYQLSRTRGPRAVTRIHAAGSPDVSVISFGGSGLETEKAAIALLDEEVNLDIFYPSFISSFDVEPMLESVEQTRRLLIVEEGTRGLSLASQYLVEIFRRLSPESRRDLRFTELTALPRPLPAAQYLEAQLLPTAGKIRVAAMDLFLNMTRPE